MTDGRRPARSETRLATALPAWHYRAMRILPIGLCLTVLMAPPAAADDALTGAEFDAYTRGHTFTFGSAGTPYGAEQYMDHRRVRWTFLDGQCLEGEWYEQDGLICFVYDTEPMPQCWTFMRRSGGLVARFAADPAPSALYEVERSETPLACPGPDVGV